MKITKEDIYGQRHPIESTVDIPAKIAALREEMEHLPDADGWKQAQDKCPELLDNDFMLMFLRCDVFNVPLAAKRLAKYWNKRIFALGPSRAFLPVTQSEALKDDVDNMTCGFFRLTGTKDPSGRNICVYDPSLRDPNMNVRQQFRYGLYMCHKVLQDTATQQKGVIIVVLCQKWNLGCFNRRLDQALLENLTGVAPIRISAIHICQPPPAAKFVWPVVKMLLGKRMIKRVRGHFGSNDKVLASLLDCGLKQEVLPSDIGGDVVLNHHEWLEDNRRFEDERIRQREPQDVVVRLTPMITLAY